MVAGLGGRGKAVRDQSSGLSWSTRSRLVGVARRLRPLNKPCKPCMNRASRANRALTGGAIASEGIPTLPPARVPLPLLHACQLEVEQRPACSSRSLPLGYSAKAHARCRTGSCAEQNRPFSTSAGRRGPIGSAKPLSSFPRFSGCQVRVLCITAMFPLSTTMQSLIDAWEEAQSSGQWQEPQPEPAYPAAWWLIQLDEEPQELEPPLRWSV